MRTRAECLPPPPPITNRPPTCNPIPHSAPFPSHSLTHSLTHSLNHSFQDALTKLQAKLKPIPGVQIEDNKFALSVHTRNVSDEGLFALDAALDAALEEQPMLRRSASSSRHHVIELKPQVNWHKGRAVEWLLKNMCEQMGLPSGAAERSKTILPIYIGDDTTDEDAFELLRANGYGIPIVVRERAPKRGETAAEFWLQQRDVAEFLALFLHDRVLIGAAEHVGTAEPPPPAADAPAQPGPMAGLMTGPGGPTVSFVAAHQPYD